MLVGDAAAFMDPFYSPGMDWISFTEQWRGKLITVQRDGRADGGARRRSTIVILRAVTVCWFEALYKDKHEYIGEFDLMSLAFLLDLGPVLLRGGSAAVQVRGEGALV